ncbi:ATP-grasp domain-containing protein [Leuconostoc sp. JNUCC 76]
MNRVLLVEPSFYGVEFVKSAKSLGCEVVCVVSNQDNPKKYGYEDYYDDLIVADIRNAESILEAIEKSSYTNFDAIIPATDYVTEITAKVNEKLQLFGNSVSATHFARNKDAARKVYAQKNVPSAKFSVVKNIDEAIQASQKIGFPLVLKPVNTASSINVFYIDTVQTLVERFQEMTKLKESYMGFKVKNEYLMEEFLTGPEFSVELFLNSNSIAFVEVTAKKTTKPPYFVELMHTFPAEIRLEDKQVIVDAAFKAVQSIGFENGPAHVEVKLTETGPKIIEVNGRPGGDCITSDLILNAYGVNIFTKTVELYLNRKITFNVAKNKCSIIKFLFSNKSGRLKEIKGLKEIKSLPEFNRMKIMKQLGDTVIPPTNSDDRIGYYILTGNSASELVKKVQDVEQFFKMKFE